MNIAMEAGILIISDEIYEKLVYDGFRFFSVASFGEKVRQNTIIINGVSKAYAMTGWRLGYMVVPDNMAKRLQDFLVSSISCTASFTQWAGLEALTGDQSFIPHMMARFKEKRDKIVQGLNSIPNFSCQTPKGAFYAFPNIVQTGMTSEECADHLIYKAGVAILPGTAFGPYGEGYLRFSYASTIKKIDTAIKRIKESFEQ